MRHYVDEAGIACGFRGQTDPTIEAVRAWSAVDCPECLSERVAKGEGGHRPEAGSWVVWRPIADLPPDGAFVLLAGPSGWTTTPWFFVVGRRHESYHPRLLPGVIRWLGIDNSPLSDDGYEPTHWSLMPAGPTSWAERESKR